MIPIQPQETSRITLELRELIEGGVDLWAFDYPSYYKGEEKKAFEKKVIDHFYFRQIGQETVGRFLHVFRRTVREIMPMKIQRYKSIELMDDPDIRPLDNYFMTEEFEEDRQETRTGSGTSSSSSSTSGSGSIDHTEGKDTTHADKETPQGSLAWNINNQGDINIDHASNVWQEKNDTKNTETSTASEEGSITGETSSEDSSTGGTTHKLTRRGNIGVTTYAQMLEGYRATFIDVDLEIIEELETCFLGVY